MNLPFLFFSDCYANKDKVAFSKDTHKNYYSPSPETHLTDTYRNSSPKHYIEKTNIKEYYDNMKLPSKSFPVHISPGLKAELEFELRHYARVNHGCINVKFLEEKLEKMDTYRTGKVLHKEVGLFSFLCYIF